jgi:hypothetical protein
MIEIPLRNRSGEIVAHAKIDDEDWEHVGEYRWCLHNGGYARRGGMKDGVAYTVLLHRQILGLREGDRLQVDHINRDKLDCQRSNLRLADDFYNGQTIRQPRGTSQYRGVSWSKRHSKWVAKAMLDRKNHYLGLYESEDEAAAVALAFRKEHMPYALD